MEFKEINETNYSQVASIYLEGIATGMATFETSAPEWKNWDKGHLPFGRIALYENEKMLGWGSLSPVSSRCVYGGVAEVSVYVGQDARGQGVGRRILEQLVKISEENGLWTLQSGIMRENIGSINLHIKCGFREIGFREKVSQLNGDWKDNVLMERRSKVVGV
ncbi:GNAT family N-acetyltransferase [Portibacter lacus]|uniref:N-acetyltransferase n=1 Tax=Portibacter lacus TaxID=1099794 RepID=A0AA37SPU7_9BACT|nr:GNAT family N-acetyltransferase [Portibacter lacus]GLR16959.1 N-acetyltransferase [Portibacter lacus]